MTTPNDSMRFAATAEPSLSLGTAPCIVSGRRKESSPSTS